MNLLVKRLNNFLFNYNFYKPFVFLRIAVALFSILIFISTASDMQNLIGLNGLTGREITEATISTRFIPRISWLIDPLMKEGFTDEKSIVIIMWIYATAMIFMLAGLFTRVSVFIVWIIQLMICNSNQYFFSYGADTFTNIALLYCLIMPANQFWSLDNLLFKKEKKKFDPVYESFFIRMLQTYLCVVYFFEGFFKIILLKWVTGDSMWISLMIPRFNIINFSFMAYHPFITKLTGWIIVALEFFYPVMMYFTRTRKPWLVLVILMHVCIGIFMKLPFFGIMMIILNIAAFGWNEFYDFFFNLFKRLSTSEN
jgi:hypothetical protein